MNAIDWSVLSYAVLFLLLGLVLAIAEVFIVSFGLLSVAALASLAVAVYFAFQLGVTAGWVFLLLALVLLIGIIRWGLNWVRGSKLVPVSTIKSDAGYRHVAERIGVEIGSVGTLVTPAHPSGRARFANGECDVQVRGYVLERGTEVVVKRIDGPIIFVVPVISNE